MLPAMLAQIGGAGLSRAGVSAAVSVLLMVPPVVMFLFCQRSVIETMAHSGLNPKVSDEPITPDLGLSGDLAGEIPCTNPTAGFHHRLPRATPRREGERHCISASFACWRPPVFFMTGLKASAGILLRQAEGPLGRRARHMVAGGLLDGITLEDQLVLMRSGIVCRRRGPVHSGHGQRSGGRSVCGRHRAAGGGNGGNR